MKKIIAIIGVALVGLLVILNIQSRKALDQPQPSEPRASAVVEETPVPEPATVEEPAAVLPMSPPPVAEEAVAVVPVEQPEYRVIPKITLSASKMSVPTEN